MSPAKDPLVQSIKARLVHTAHERHQEPNRLLNRYALERFLYRLSCSPHAERFILKGAMLLVAWLGETTRSTRDADFLGVGTSNMEELPLMFRRVAQQEVPPDGMRYDHDSIRSHLIRQQDPAGGLRINLLGYLGTARFPLQIDVGLGDAVVPPAEWLEYPTLLDHPAPRLRAYRPETSIAEKLHAMVTLGTRTSRLRDFFDIRSLARSREFDAANLVAAVRATFENKGTPYPASVPGTLTARFAEDPLKQSQWQGFLRRADLAEGAEDDWSDFKRVVDEVGDFVLPVLKAARGEVTRIESWSPGGPWLDE